MSDHNNEKSDVEQVRDIISQLKEMHYYSKSNVEKLSEFWLLLEEQLKHKEHAGKVGALLNQQSAFHDELEEAISDFEIECNRIDNESE